MKIKPEIKENHEKRLLKKELLLIDLMQLYIIAELRIN